MKKIFLLVFALIAGVGFQGCRHSNCCDEFQSPIPADDPIIGTWEGRDVGNSESMLTYAPNGTYINTVYNGGVEGGYWGKTKTKGVYFGSNSPLQPPVDRIDICIIFMSPSGQLKVSQTNFSPKQIAGFEELIARGELPDVQFSTTNSGEWTAIGKLDFVGKKKSSATPPVAQ